jgi:hypothetical protein
MGSHQRKREREREREGERKKERKKENDANGLIASFECIFLCVAQ